MKKEKIVKTHTRKTKSGKTVTVRQHTAKYDAAEEAKKMAQKAGSGKEFESKSKEYKVTKDDLDTLGMSMKELDSLAKKLGVSHSDAASWYSGSDFSNFSKSGSVRADKAARKVVGEDAYKKHKGSQNLVDMVMSGTGARPGKTLQKRGASNEKTGTITRKEISDLDSSIGKIRKSAKVLGLTEREAASWVEGPNWCSYNEKHLNKGNRAAKKFLGSEWYNKLDKTGSAIPQAVLHKIKGGTYDQKSEKKNELSVKDKSFKKLNKKQLSADDKKKGGVTIKSKSVSKGKGKEVVKGSKNIERVSAKSLEKVSKGNSKKPVQESKKVEARYSEKDKKYIYPYKELSTDARRAVREWKHFGKTHPPRGIGYNEGGYKVRHDEMDKHFGKGKWGITWGGKVYNPKLKS